MTSRMKTLIMGTLLVVVGLFGGQALLVQQGISLVGNEVIQTPTKTVVK